MNIMPLRKELSLWDKEAPRGYMSFTLCSPLNSTSNNHDDLPDDLVECANQLRADRHDAVDNSDDHDTNYDNVAIEFVEEEGKQGHIFLKTSDSDFIPCEKLEVAFNYSYDELKKDDFPAHMFVNPALTIPATLEQGGVLVPVSRLGILSIDGGFILFVYVHHAYADGKCVDMFLQLLSEQTGLGSFDSNSNSFLMDCDINLPLGQDRCQIPFPELLVTTNGTRWRELAISSSLTCPSWTSFAAQPMGRR